MCPLVWVHWEAGEQLRPAILRLTVAQVHLLLQLPECPHNAPEAADGCFVASQLSNAFPGVDHAYVKWIETYGGESYQVSVWRSNGTPVGLLQHLWFVLEAGR